MKTDISIDVGVCVCVCVCVCVGVCICIGGVTTHTEAPHRTPTEHVSAALRAKAERRAYKGQSRHGSRVPRADVRVERLRIGERLQADRQQSTGDVKNE